VNFKLKAQSSKFKAVKKLKVMKKKDFAFKDLIVWDKAIDFAIYAISLSENLKSTQKHYRHRM